MNAIPIPIVSSAWLERLQRRNQSNYSAIWQVLDQVKDPEVPVVSIWDLGILTDVSQVPSEQGICTVVTITPTYSGCPAMDAIRKAIGEVLTANEFTPYQVHTKLAPAWSTDSISPEGRKQLRDYGIAPPSTCCQHADGMTPEFGVECPHCGSSATKRISEFGSTACKALFQCQHCLEPFDYFKHL
ncbi:MAG: 1,2-phenylacetyl-CoA epoxidase subunit PaaD [Thiofilum sp.]|uniref:1,2-phenylacetyl-CoA epoxidase subunit PaaD n=1 Tax=Thiofilum sp. TaxID=2212733 RepID=UPI0025F33741|nr:1,2-phenylacetyl-CoA epoxidase subunit PaaD [Thiofilum sp.]MBK8454272.1 phenylacetate-CoA oxygenase subunit PaaJ [Thiofilum sp.]